MFSVTCPGPFSDLKYLYRKRLTLNDSDRVESYHLKLAGFENLLKDCRLRFNSSVESVAGISLPFQFKHA